MFRINKVPGKQKRLVIARGCGEVTSANGYSPGMMKCLEIR